MRAHGVADEVVFAGADSEVRPYLSCADIFCLATDVEPLPVSCLQILAMGVPAAVIDLGGVKEPLQPGVSGLVGAPRDPQAVAAVWNFIAVDSEAREWAIQSVVARSRTAHTAAQCMRGLTLTSFASKLLQQSWGSSR